MSVTAQDIANLRAQTGAGMLDCKKALDEAGGNHEKAIEILRAKGITKAAKRAGNVASEGIVGSYIHGGGKVGVLVEVNCETDFVAKNDAFQTFVKDIAMHIAASAPRYVSRSEVPAEEVEKEKRVYREQMAGDKKPADMIEKIIEGKLGKFYSETCLLEQSFIKDEDKTVEQLLIQKTSEIGEKITVRRFARFVLGEGIEKKEKDFVAEVEAQLTH
ncbi:MAG: translation elongation factor Ts [Patescibacteria group bacterium]